MSKGNLNAFRKIGMFEGLSWLVLIVLTINKYVLDGSHTLVSIVGNIHGFLFVLYIVFMIIVGNKYKWGGMMYVIALVAAVLPFGTFVYDKKFLKPLSEK